MFGYSRKGCYHDRTYLVVKTKEEIIITNVGNSSVTSIFIHFFKICIENNYDLIIPIFIVTTHINSNHKICWFCLAAI